jgi:hypothetical protein
MDAQKRLVLNDLLAGDSLTPQDALFRYGCMRLGARIWELKRDGWDIKRELIPVNGKNGVAWVAAYRLEKA